MEKNKSKNGWGGKREGSGRPKTTTIQRVYSIRTNDELAEYIDSHENKSDFIKACVIKEMKGQYGVVDVPEVHTNDVVSDVPKDEVLSVEVPQIPESASLTEKEAPAIHTESFNDFDYSLLGEVCGAESVKTINVPLVETQTDASSFHMETTVEDVSQDVDLLKLLCPKLNVSSLIRVKGDSMTDADIYDGDIIIVDRSNRNPTDRELAVCELNGEYTIKYVRVRDQRGILVPANRDYPEWRITPDDHFNIWGTVTYVIHQPRNL